MKSEPLSPVLKNNPWSPEKPRRKPSFSNHRNGNNRPKYQRYSRSPSPSYSPPSYPRRNQPLYKNLSWVRPITPPQETATSGGGSLLTRIEPASGSLLRRLAPSDSDSISNGSSGNGYRVAKASRGLSTPEREAEAFAERVIRESEAVMIQNAQKKADVIDVDLESGVGKVGAACGDSKVSMQPGAIDSRSESLSRTVPQASPEGLVPTNGVSLRRGPSRDTARPCPPDDTVHIGHANHSSFPSKTTSQPESSSSNLAPKPSHLSVVDEARRLIVPIIVKKVHLQEPQTSIQKVEEKVSRLVTDQHCVDFVKLAKQVQGQIRARDTRASSREGERRRELARENTRSQSASFAHDRGGGLSGSDGSGFSEHRRPNQSGESRDRDERGSERSHHDHEGRFMRGERSEDLHHRGRSPRREYSRDRGKDHPRDTYRSTPPRSYVPRENGTTNNVNGHGYKRGRVSRSPSEDTSRPTKIPRQMSSATPAPPAIPQTPTRQISKEGSRDLTAIMRTPSSSTVVMTPSVPKRATPKMPKAMLVDSTVLAIESFLASAPVIPATTKQVTLVSEEQPETHAIRIENSGTPPMRADSVAETHEATVAKANDTGNQNVQVEQQPDVVTSGVGADAQLECFEAPDDDIRSSPMVMSEEAKPGDPATAALVPLQLEEALESSQGSLLLGSQEQLVNLKAPSAIPGTKSPSILDRPPETLDPLPIENELPPIPLLDVEMTIDEEEEVLQHIVQQVEEPVPMEVSTDNEGEVAPHPEEPRTETQSIPTHDDIHVDGEYAAPHNHDIDLPPGASLQQQSSPQLSSSFPPCLVPGFWFATVGKPQPDILDLEFVVDEASAASALRWGNREKSFECVFPGLESRSARHIALYLLCVPAAEAAEANERLDPTATPEEVARAMWSIGTRWPGRGKLVVQFNAGWEHEKNWFPFDFKDGRPLEVSAYVRPGTNTARIVQLESMEDRVFILYAATPSEVQVKDQAEKITKGSCRKDMLGLSLGTGETS